MTSVEPAPDDIVLMEPLVDNNGGDPTVEVSEPAPSVDGELFNTFLYGEPDAIGENGNGDADGDFFNDDGDSDDDDFVVTIGEIKSNAVFQKAAPVAVGLAGGRPELDGTPSHKGVPIYDLDLASMDEKPWRKPGADITDYFNFGFNEDTWNQYCERQKKLRTEYGTDQAAINRALFNSIVLPTGGTGGGSGGQQLSAMSGGRQLVNILSGGSEKQQKINKVVIDLSKPPPIGDSQSSIIRTIIGGAANNSSSIVNSSPLISLGASSPALGSGAAFSSNLVGLTGGTGHLPPTADFSKPPPSASVNISAANSVASTGGFNGPPPMASDFSKPPPSLPPPQQQQPPPVTSTVSIGAPMSSLSTAPSVINLNQPSPLGGLGLSGGLKASASLGDCPPGVDEPDIPGVSTPPPGLPSFTPMGQSSQMGFNPSIPPPGGRLPGMNVPPPSLYPQQPPFMSGSSGVGVSSGVASGVMYSTRPQPLFPQRGSAGFGNPPGVDGGDNGRRTGGGRDYRDRDRDRDYGGGGSKDYSSGDSGDETYRRKRRRRSRSTSMDRIFRRRKEDKDRDRDYLSRRREESPHDSSAASRSSKRKSDRSEKDRSGVGESKRRSRRSPDDAGGEPIEDRSERRRKKHERLEKEKEKS